MASRDIEAAVITRLRAELAAQVKAPLMVSAKATQYWFDEESAAHSDIDVRHGETFAVVVVQGALPSEELIVRIWHRYADEVWLVDRSEQVISVVPRTGVIRVYEIGEAVRSVRLPDISISVAAMFGVVN
jgi:hypothetical protein